MLHHGNRKEPKLRMHSRRVRRKEARAAKDEVAPVAHVGRVEDLIFKGNAHR